MKICTISLINNQPINTGGKSLSYYVNSLLSKKHTVQFYYFEDTGESIWLSYTAWFEPIHIQKENPWFFRLFPAFLQKMHFEFLMWNRSELRKIQTDCILLEFPYLYHIAKSISKRNNNCPIILLEHNIEWQYFRSSGSILWILVYFFEMYVLRRIKNIITISPKDAEYLKEHYRSKSIYSLEPWVISEIYTKEWEKFNYNTGWNILFYGRLDAPTNNEALQYLMSEIVPSLPENTRLNIFWSGKIDTKMFQDKWIVFHGTVPSPVPYIRWADMMIVPIKNAAWVKIRLLEWLYCEKIILCSPEAAEWLHPLLQECVIICKETKNYIDTIQKLIIDMEYRRHQEDTITKNIARYKELNENSIYTIFDSIIPWNR